MTTMTQLETDKTISLSEWLAQKVPEFTSTELVTDHPWARTYRVTSSAGTYFAKQLPACQQETLDSIVLLSHAFGMRVPEVVAVCQESGFLLLRDHNGKSMYSLKDRDRSLDLLQMYGGLQSEAARNVELLSCMPKIELVGLQDHFLNFFSPAHASSSNVGAAHFLGERKATYYRDRLSTRLHLLRPLLEASQNLPQTINHCDLRAQNAAIREDGSCVLFDWDDAIVGPAGMSLHNLFDGCSIAMSLLGKELVAARNGREYSVLLDGYLSALVTGGYASREQLEIGLPGAICAGVMRYLMSYGKFPTDDEDFRHVIAKIIRRCTDDLLQGCDDLVLPNRSGVLAHVVDYEGSQSPEPAVRLICGYLRGAQSDLEMEKHLASNLFQLGKVEEAERVCRQCLEREPEHPEMRFLLGHIGLELLDLDSAIDQWTLAQKFGLEKQKLDGWIDEVRHLQLSYRAADRPGVVPSVRYSSIDDEVGTFSRLRSRIATGMFREYGTLLVENVFSPDLLNTLHDEFTSRYWPQLQNGNSTGALQVGNRRFMVTLDLAGPFNDPSLFANPFLMIIFRRLLSNDFIMGSFTAVTALPNAADMRMHKDHTALFHTSEFDQPLPTFAVTMLLPLLGLNAEMGTTRVVKRSQSKSSEEAAKMEYQDPLGPQGSCLLMDYRLSHQGLANRSNRVRPVLSLVYNRSWFRDSSNYKKQQPLEMSRQELERVPDDNRHLFDWLFPTSSK